MQLYNYHNTPSTLIGFNERMNIFPYIKSQLSTQKLALQQRFIRGPHNNDLILLAENTIRTLTKLIINRHRFAETADDVYYITRLCKTASKELLDLVKELLHSTAVSPRGKETLRNILDQVNQLPLSVDYEGNGEDLIWPRNSREFELIKQDPVFAARFTRHVVKRHMPELEPTLLKLSPRAAVDYLEDGHREDWSGVPPMFRGKLEDIISQDALASLMYVQRQSGDEEGRVDREPFLKAERTIYFNKDPYWTGTGNPSDETAWEMYLSLLPEYERKEAEYRASRFKR